MDTMTDTLDTLKLQLAQLQELHTSGVLDAPAFEAGKEKIERQILDAVLIAKETVPPIPPDVQPKLSWFLVAGVGACIIALAGLGYWYTRPPVASSNAATSHVSGPAGPNVGQPHPTNFDQIGAMTERLAARMKEQPNDAEGWAMLARSYSVLGRHPEALSAYEKAVALRKDDPQLLADYAKSLAIKNNAKVVGSSAISSLSTNLGPVAAPAVAVSGTVRLAPAFQDKVQPGDTVFVFARAVEGSRMPLALVRKQVKDLPFQFTLDDSTAMSPASKISGAQKVIVGARVSKSGNAMPQPGDLSVQSSPVALGTSGLQLEIREMVAQ
jgi:cytochrome c-type biogenesis protein CcmH